MENSYNKDIEDLVAIENYRMMIELSEEIFHDFKNILATISGLAQLSMIKTQSDELKGYLSRINEATCDFRDTLNKYYSYTIGNVDAKEEPHVLYVIVNDAIEMIKYRLHEPGIFGKELNLNIRIRSNSKVLCNGYDMKQCFLNILMNSIDSMEDTGGILTVEVYNNSSNEFLIVEIIDTGTGISNENLEKLFKARFTTKKHGTGLGLNIAKNCVENYGGELEITSKLNVGTRVKISLPIYNEDNIIQ
ncbi:HAMP domain-containing sensor histidine kinase [Tissierella sp. Yu-01]|uniref:ATP-binding protein n=1 Tax=Tissierella sp. Yu-01 TaxID=3035694 RepID=UPI00240D07A1|nr:HAMP domain-containing sensor histidine kinase [Tissierella sp. Yu-01]WFA08710.1 HAMP domain-containing sensor histidine kinase [Tissierella sp. Yu-01]